jgi:hypothetical protein
MNLVCNATTNQGLKQWFKCFGMEGRMGFRDDHLPVIPKLNGDQMKK